MLAPPKSCTRRWPTPHLSDNASQADFQMGQPKVHLSLSVDKLRLCETWSPTEALALTASRKKWASCTPCTPVFTEVQTRCVCRG